jgi:hypothetical protein
VYRRLLEDRDYGIHLSAEFDTIRNIFVMIVGEQEFLYDLTPGKPSARIKMKTTGDREIINSQGPGLAYDPRSRQIIAWAGGSKVYALDLDKKTWTAISNTGDPGPAICNGTYGRWAYSAKSQAFITYNWYENNAFLLRLPVQQTGVASTRSVTSSVLKLKKTQPAKIKAPSPIVNSKLVASVITSSMDTYLGIYQKNAGKLAYLNLSTNQRTLVQFESAKLKQKSRIHRATLRMYQKNSDPMSPIYTGVFLSNHEWKEDSNWKYSHAASKIEWLHSAGDWQDKMGVVQGGQPFDLQQVIVNPAGQWLEWEVTGLVKRWQAENKTSSLGIVLKSLSGQEQPVQFYSRDHEDATLRPQLVIEADM